MLSRLADFVRSRPVLRRAAHAAVRLIPDRPYTLNVPQVGPIRIRMRRHRHMLWEKFGQGDQLMLATFRRLIRPGDVVYDIGANIGIYTRLMVQWHQATQVIAFEPMSENFEMLQANIALGKIETRVQAHRIALSDKEGREDLQIDDMTSGTAVLSSVSGGQASAGRREFGLPPLSESVMVLRLDDFVERQNVPPPQFMKIDTEGAEVKVLRGAMETIQRGKPRLAVALHSLEKSIGTLEILDELQYFAFGFVHQEKGSGMFNWKQIHARDAEMLANNNIVASCAMDDVREPISPK